MKDCALPCTTSMPSCGLAGAPAANLPETGSRKCLRATKERHPIKSSGWLRAAVFGGERRDCLDIESRTAAAHATHGSKLIDRVFARHGRQPDGAMLQHNCATGHVTTVVGPLVRCQND